MSVCGIKLCIQKRKQLKPEAKIKWKLKKEECCSEVWKELRQALGGRYDLLDDWEDKAVLLRQTPKKVSSMDRGKRTRIPDAGMIKYRILFKRWRWKKWDSRTHDENRQDCVEARCTETRAATIHQVIGITDYQNSSVLIFCFVASFNMQLCSSQLSLCKRERFIHIKNRLAIEKCACVSIPNIRQLRPCSPQFLNQKAYKTTAAVKKMS